jgi:KaiC/GvpD/RAD55 family RecA-like ATPase
MNELSEKGRSALDLARRGFRVFPLLPNRKRPALTGWKTAATCDEEQVVSWWRERPNANVGIATGKGLMVIDLDRKDGKDGLRALENLDFIGDIPYHSMTVETPSGGLHLYVRVPDDQSISISAGKIAEGVDIRCEGGLVAAPGSTVDGKPYRQINGSDILDCPAWLVSVARKAVVPPAAPRIDIEVDTPFAILSATRALSELDPVGEGVRNSAVFIAACLARDYGVTEAYAAELVDVCFNSRCFPPLDLSEVEATVASAFKTARNEPGCKNAEGRFGAVPEESVDFDPFDAAEPADDVFPLTLVSDASVDLTKMDLVKGLVGAGSLVCLYGDSNVGKTFVALELCRCVAAGEEFAGRKVQQGGVLYFAAEAGPSAARRMMALRMKHKMAGVPFAYVTSPISFINNAKDVRKIIRTVEAFKKEHGCEVVMVVIDTVSAVMEGGNENASESMTGVVQGLKAIQHACGCTVMAVHHQGKQAANGMRGHSSLNAAMDQSILVTEGLIEPKKLRDEKTDYRIGFALDVIELGKDGDGEPVTSCTVRTTSVAEMKAAGDNPFVAKEGDMWLWNVFLEQLAVNGRKNSEGKRFISLSAWRGAAKDKILKFIADPINAEPIPPGALAAHEGGVEKYKEWLRSTRERLNRLGGFEKNDADQCFMWTGGNVST